MHDFDQLLFGAAVGVVMFVIHLGQVGADVVFQHHRQQAIHGDPDVRDSQYRMMGHFVEANPQADLLGGLGRFEQTLDPMELFPYSPLIGRGNPLSPPVRFEVKEGVVHGLGRFGAQYCGPPNHVHGGVVAAVMDELLGAVNVVNDLGAMTGTLTVRYRRPTPLFEEIRMEGRTSETQGRKVFAQGKMWHGDDLLAEAEGIRPTFGD